MIGLQTSKPEPGLIPEIWMPLGNTYGLKFLVINPLPTNYAYMRNAAQTRAILMVFV